MFLSCKKQALKDRTFTKTLCKNADVVVATVAHTLGLVL